MGEQKIIVKKGTSGIIKLKDNEALLEEIVDLKELHNKDQEIIKQYKVKIKKLRDELFKVTGKAYDIQGKSKKQRPVSAAESGKNMSQVSDKAAQLRPTINRMQEEITQLKNTLIEKNGLISELKERSSLTRCKRLEEELVAEKKRSEEYEKSHKLLQSIEAAYNEHKKEQNESEMRDKGVILASIKATLSAWNNCPSYVKQHMTKQEEEIKSLKAKLASTTRTKSVVSENSQIVGNSVY